MLETLVLVRHGESEGNVVYNRLVRGLDDQQLKEVIRRRPNISWRLTDNGRSQINAAGKWIVDNLGASFDRYYTSDSVRTMESAALLNLPNAHWWLQPSLRERDFGLFDLMIPEEDRMRYLRLFPGLLEGRDDADYLTSPPHGESLIDLILRANLMYEPLHWEGDGERGIVVCHEMMIWAIRVRIERLAQEQFKKLFTSSDPTNHIHNGQILVYTRSNPETQEPSPVFEWMRSVCPWDNERSLNKGEWTRITRPEFNNDDLLGLVNRIPREITD
jgi:NAD+ kinase